MNRGGFSWKRLTGISAAKSKIGRKVGIPLTRSGRQRKIGGMMGGCLIPVIVVLLMIIVVASVSAGEWYPLLPSERVGIERGTPEYNIWLNEPILYAYQQPTWKVSRQFTVHVYETGPTQSDNAASRDKTSGGRTWVNSYTRKDGTRVRGYSRRRPR